MLVAILFLCIGFMIAVLYIDLVFDISALSHRHAGRSVPHSVLDPIATYYRYITKNPLLLMLVMLITTTCVIAEMVVGSVPQWIGYASLSLVVLNALVAIGKVIPTAQRLAAGRDSQELQSRMVHSLLPYHIVLLIAVLLLATIQFVTLLQ